MFPVHSHYPRQNIEQIQITKKPTTILLTRIRKSFVVRFSSSILRSKLSPRLALSIRNYLAINKFEPMIVISQTIRLAPREIKKINNHYSLKRNHASTKIANKDKWVEKPPTNNKTYDHSSFFKFFQGITCQKREDKMSVT